MNNIPFGVTFYPDQWPQDTWDESLRQIKAAGFNIIRFGEMAWDWFEPQPGKFNFKDLDKALAVCHKHGIKVLLGIPTSQVPPWFHRLYPGSRPVAQDGTLYPEYGPRPNICKDNPHYKKLARRLATQLVTRYHNHPALAMWQVDNEPVYPPLDHTTANDFCHCEHSRQHFIAWAKNKYVTLEKLNRVWGAKFWTNTFSTFDDIQTPKAGIWEAVSPHIFLDWMRFKTDSLREWISSLAQSVKKVDKKHPVGTNGFIGICTRTPDHSLMAKSLDWYGLDIYPKGGKMSAVEYAFMLDLWRSFARAGDAEFHITELQGGQNVRWGNPAYVEGPEMIEWTKTAMQHGVQAILYHAWRPPIFGAETGGFGILKTDGSATKRLEAIRTLSKYVPVGDEYFQPRAQNIVPLQKPSTAIVYLHSSEIQSYQEQGPPRGIVGQWEAVRSDIGIMHAIQSMQGAYQTLYKEGQTIDFIFEQDLDQGNLSYKTLLLPNPYLLSKKQYQNLLSWIEKGGRLITEARFGLKDENGHLYLKPLLEDLLDIEYEYTIPIKEGFLDVIKGKPKKPQLIRKKVGKGTVVYANFSLFLELQKGHSRWLNILQKT